MEIIESAYRNDVVFVGHGFENISNDTMAEAIERSTGREIGRDFDGIGREDMEAPHTNTKKDLKAFGELLSAYRFVEFVTLYPVR